MTAATHVDPPSPYLLLSEVRAVYELATFYSIYPWLRFLPRGDGHPVLVIPGLAASDMSTIPLRGFLKDRGYGAHGWRLGRNVGPRPGLFDRKLDRLAQLRKRYGRKVSLIGWSLGGLYARELARAAPDDVRLVIALGSPLRGNPRASNAWRLYEHLSGSTVDHARDIFSSDAPPVPMSAVFSRTDGVVSWQCCLQDDGPQIENIEIESSHCGIAHNPAALFAIADRLAQPEGAWQPFRRGGMRRLFFPDPSRSVGEASAQRRERAERRIAESRMAAATTNGVGSAPGRQGGVEAGKDRAARSTSQARYLNGVLQTAS
jgi:pimeloyl-ACP methyl ester carboxylesterase